RWRSVLWRVGCAEIEPPSRAATAAAQQQQQHEDDQKLLHRNASTTPLIPHTPRHRRKSNAQKWLKVRKTWLFNRHGLAVAIDELSHATGGNGADVGQRRAGTLSRLEHGGDPIGGHGH